MFITLDKMDKIGLEGVADRAERGRFLRESIETHLGTFTELTPDAAGEALRGQIFPRCGCKICGRTGDHHPKADAVKSADFKIVFDPTLVRGMGYYTGPIFEIAMDEFGGTVGGGGRYDKMIGKFTGLDTPACGFSIGFERIVMLLLERGYEVPGTAARKAYLIEKNMPADRLLEVPEEGGRRAESGTDCDRHDDEEEQEIPERADGSGRLPGV